MPITHAEKLKVLKREIALRRGAYPKWVKTGRMKQAEADREIEVMVAIAADYALLVEADKDKGDLL